MESNLNGRLLSSPANSKLRHNNGDNDKEHGDSKSKRASWQATSKDAPQDHARRQSSRSSTFANSLYDSPTKPSSSERRPASVSGPTSVSIPDSPILTQDLADLWNEKAMSESGLSQHDPSASMIIEDASPPLPWKDPSSRFSTGDTLSSSQRFSVDSLSGGAFAMPTSQQPSLSSSRQLSLTEADPGNESTKQDVPAIPSAETKRRKWQSPKVQKIIESSLIGEDIKEEQTVGGDPSSPSLSEVHLFDSPIAQASPPTFEQSTPKLTKNLIPKSSAFGLRGLSGPGSGIVSGLTSLKNSIMIPALSFNHKPESSTARSQSSSLAASQSSLLDFVVPDRPSSRQGHRQHDSSSSTAASSPFVITSSFVSSGNGAPRSKRDVGVKKSFRRRRMASQNSSILSLSNLETGFQQLVRKQSQLSAHKVDLCRELISLYSRRNTNEKKQEEAIAAEAFEDAEAAGTTIYLIQERIMKLESIYGETDKALWEAKKQQDELGQSIVETHGAVMQEMDQMRQAREQEKRDYQEEMEKQREIEQARIQAERQEIKQAGDEIAARKEVLEKEREKIAGHVGTDTAIEQVEMTLLLEKRAKVRTEIQELEKRLSGLRQQDKELSHGIDKFQKQIDVVAKKFEEQTTALTVEMRQLERQNSEIQSRTHRLDQQESHLQKIVDGTGSTQVEISAEIDAIVSQQSKLEEVRQQFVSELGTIQKLRLEEEAFREKEASWTLRASSLSEDVRKQDRKLCDLTDRIAQEQKALTDLEYEIETCQKRILKAESLKDISVQRRDFKQASQLSSEITRQQGIKKDLESQLESLSARLKAPADNGLESLRHECDNVQTFVKGEEATLAKEIQAAVVETLARLDTLAKELSSGHGAEPEAGLTAGQLSLQSLNEIRSEVEHVREMSRIRFGREETVHSSLLTTKDMLGEDQVDVQRRKLERSIQAAVAEEDYDAAANLQAQLDAL
ncbi:hypothetical protein EMPS_10049 [Entomortierella parvispora]|uniref:UVR domain-containing protein n=1 Tax=Entomortierella parvispora TaxID=205924 RepID=A0A9P3HJF9_9FUNG|nr:hypothetical protein EMPS_10049 [Entomortierella parvispora]